MVMIRSVEPGRGSSMVMLAPESPRILRIRAPPLPIIAPANCKEERKNRQHVMLGNGRAERGAYVFRNGNLCSLGMAAIVFTENPFVVVHPVDNRDKWALAKLVWPSEPSWLETVEL